MQPIFQSCFLSAVFLASSSSSSSLPIALMSQIKSFLSCLVFKFWIISAYFQWVICSKPKSFLFLIFYLRQFLEYWLVVLIQGFPWVSQWRLQEEIVQLFIFCLLFTILQDAYFQQFFFLWLAIALKEVIFLLYKGYSSFFAILLLNALMIFVFGIYRRKYMIETEHSHKPEINEQMI